MQTKHYIQFEDPLWLPVGPAFALFILVAPDLADADEDDKGNKGAMLYFKLLAWTLMHNIKN